MLVALPDVKKSDLVWCSFYGLMLFCTLSPSPFPAGNQDPYLFWAINKACGNCLATDFLATQPDGFPAFSFIFGLFPLVLFPLVSHLLFWAACMVYAFAWQVLAGIQHKKVMLMGLVLHSTLIWGLFCRKFFGYDLAWIWHHGLAEQGLLFGYFQPSTLGVFLLVALAFYFMEHIPFFIVSVTLAGAFHANYSVLGGLLFLAFLIHKPALFRQHWKWMLIPLMLWSLYLGYSYYYFTSSDPSFIQASEYYIHNNPHLDPLSWLNWKSLFQLGIILAGLWLTRQLAFGYFLQIVVGLGFSFSLLAILSHNVFLINLAPWRLSVVLVPVSLVFILKSIASAMSSTRDWVSYLGLALALSLVLMAFYFKFLGNNSSQFLFNWRGAAIILFAILASLFCWLKPNFKVVALVLASILPLGGLVQYGFEKREIANWPEAKALALIGELDNSGKLYLVPPGLRAFNLKTLAATYVGNNVYFSPDLPAWKQRQEWAKLFYKTPHYWGVADLQGQGITHLLCPANLSVPSSVWELELQAGEMNCYRLNE